MDFKNLLKDANLIGKLDTFNNSMKFSDYYKQYEWRKDKFPEFDEIMKLEERFKNNLRKPVKRSDILAVINWGVPRWLNRVREEKFRAIPIAREKQETREKRAERLLEKLMEIKGVGLVIATKILRFLSPREYGVLDIQLTKRFGKCGENWLSLTDRDGSIRGKIHEEYIKWLFILQYFASKLNDEKNRDISLSCPNEYFVKKRLRNTIGEWTCADVEMALFTYAKRRNETTHKKCRAKKS